MSLLQRVLSPLVEVRKEEVPGITLMFAYAFLCMTAYNIIQPLTRSKLIASLGAVNVPWVIFGSGLLIGLLMVGYTRIVSALPRTWSLPITQVGMAGIMVVFWVLFQGGGDWVSVAFYLWGLLLGVLLISQFWTLANGVYDPRQAKRMFGFIGGGVALGGMTGAGVTATLVALGIFLIQIPLSAIWLKYFAYGPMEWIWRQLTYQQRLDLRLKR